MRPLCTVCNRRHDSTDVRVVDRFNPICPAGYRAMVPGAPLRATRAEAMLDVCPGWTP